MAKKNRSIKVYGMSGHNYVQTSTIMLKSRYDYLIIDTCPSVGALTINALAAADGVVITANPQLLALMTTGYFLCKATR